MRMTGSAAAERVMRRHRETFITEDDFRWIRDRGIPVRDGTDQVLRVVGPAEDITETRRL